MIQTIMLFNKIKNFGFPGYLFKFILLYTLSYNIRFLKTLQHIAVVLIPPNIIFSHGLLFNGKNLDFQCRKATSNVFRNYLLKSVPPLSKPIYNTHNPPGVRLLTILGLGLSHLNEHRFSQNFKGCINPLYTSTLEAQSTTHFFLHCHYYNNIRKTLLDDLKVINVDIFKLSETALTDLLLYGEVFIRFRIK